MNSIDFEIPVYSNPADYYMKLLSIKYPKRPEDDDKIEYLLNSYNEHLKEKVEQEMANIKVSRLNQEDVTGDHYAPFCVQMKELSRRALRNYLRSPRTLRARTA